MGVFGILLLFTSALFGQAAGIRGTVKDPKGAVVSGARVLLVARDNTVAAQTVSDGVGE